MIQTVCGKINKKQVKLLLAHEHLSMDLTHIRKDNVSILNDNSLLTKELNIIKKQGINLVVDMSNQSMKRNPKDLKKISTNTNIEIVAATGYYLDEYHDQVSRNKTVNDFANEFINDITIGINGTSIKAGIIGEIATGNNAITNIEKKVLIAAIKAQKQTGAPIYTHLNLGRLVKEQISLLTSNKAIAAKTIIGHSCLINDYKLLKYILDKGFKVGFDTIGKNTYVNDSKRIKNIIKLIKAGYVNQIVLSLDISKKTYLKSYGGYGYGYFIDKFYKNIKDKITHNQWKKIARDNMVKLLDFKS